MIQYSRTDSPMSPHSFLSVVRKRSKTIGLLFVVLFLTIVLAAFVWPQSFRAQATVMVNYMVDANKAHLLNLYRVDDNSYYNRINSEILIFGMQRILGPVADAIFGEKQNEQDKPVIADAEEKAARINELKSGLNIERERDTNVLKVSFDDQNPRFAAQVVDNVVSEYVVQRPTLNRDDRAYE